jgi:hypothetical protein
LIRPVGCRATTLAASSPFSLQGFVPWKAASRNVAELSHPYTLTMVLCHAGLARCLHADFATAEKLLTEALSTLNLKASDGAA